MTVPQIKTLPDFTSEQQKELDKLGITYTTLDQLDEVEFISMLYYGGSGTGKTWFVATAGPRTLIINIGNGITTIRSPEVKKRYYRDGMPLVTTVREEINRKTGLFDKAEAFDKVEAAIGFALDNFPDRFDTIAVDDASYLRAFAMNKGLEMSDDLNKSQTLKRAKENDGSLLFAVQDYGAEMKLIEDFIMQSLDFCKEYKKHFLLTAHERYIWKKIRDQQGRVTGEEIDKIRPAFTGKTFPDDVIKHFDLVWRAEVVNANPKPVYRAETEDSKGIKAKSRFPGVFRTKEINPNFLDIVSRCRESLK